MMSIFCDLDWTETADIKALGSSFFLGGPLFIIFKVKGYFGPLKTSVELRATEKKKPEKDFNSTFDDKKRKH